VLSEELVFSTSESLPVRKQKLKTKEDNLLSEIIKDPVQIVRDFFLDVPDFAVFVF
jgi:hypothetical protein